MQSLSKGAGRLAGLWCALLTLALAAQAQTPPGASSPDPSRRLARGMAMPGGAVSGTLVMDAAVGAVPAELEGAWTAVSVCRGQDQWFTVDLRGGRSAHVTLAAAGPRGASAAGEWMAGFDAGNQRLTVGPSRPGEGLPSLLWVRGREAMTWVGRLAGPGWTDCSPALMVRAETADSLRALLPPVPQPSAAGGVLRKLPLGGLGALGGLSGALGGQGARDARPKPCDPAVVAWVASFMRAAMFAPGMVPSRERTAHLVAGQYDDAALTPMTRAPLREMTARQGQQWSNVVLGALACDPANERGRGASRMLSMLAAPLSDHGELPRHHVYLDLAARPILAQWQAELTQRLDRWAQQPTRSLDAAEVHAAAVSALAWEPYLELPDGSPPLHARLTQLMAGAATTAASQAVEAQGAAVAAEMPALAKLVDALEPRRRGATVDEQARASVAARVTEQLPAAVRHMAEGARGLAGYRSLAEWQGFYAKVLALVPPDLVQQLQPSVERRMAQLADDVVAGLRGDFDQRVGQLPPSAGTIAAGVALVRQVQGEAAVLAHHPGLRVLAQDLTRRHAADLAAAERPLIVLVDGAQHADAIDALRQQHLLPGDEDTSAGRALLAALQARLQVVAPFAGLKGGDYLDAVASGDLKRVQAADDRLFASLREFMSGYLQSQAALLRLVPGGAAVLEEQRRRLDHASALPALVSTYLFNYDQHAQACLARQPTVERQIRRWRPTQVWVNGNNVEKYRITGFDETKTYRIKQVHDKLFVHLAEDGLGKDKGEGTDSSLLERWAGAEQVTDVLRGTVEALRRGPCDSPALLRLEAGFEKLYWALPR